MDADERSGPATDAGRAGGAGQTGFLQRYRLPIALGIVAACLYVGSIVYMVFVRGQIGT